MNDTHKLSDNLRREGAADFMGPGFLDHMEQQSLRRRAYEFWYHPVTELFIFALILASVILLIAELLSPAHSGAGWIGAATSGEVQGGYFWADVIITSIFLVEYVSKLWIAPGGRRWYFVRNSWIELLALLPILRFFRLLRVVRAIRIFRIFRILRSARLLRAGQLLTSVFEGFGSDLQRNRSANLIVLVYFVCTMLFGTIGILVFEQGAGSGFETIGDGLWWSVVTLSTVGYGDIVPETPEGRVVAGIVVMLGLGLWSLVTGVMTTTFIQRVKENDTLGLDLLGMSHHVVIFGWNQNGRRLIEDFRKLRPERHIVVLADTESLGIRLNNRIHHLPADPSADGALMVAQVDHADAVVILADTSTEHQITDTDARTVLLCLAARKAAEHCRLIVELLHEENRRHALYAGASAVIVSENYGGTLLSQAVQSPGLSRAFAAIFETEGPSQFKEVPFPEALVGQTFAEAAAALFRDQGVTLVGRQRDGQIQLPVKGNPDVAAGDIAIVIAADQKEAL